MKHYRLFFAILLAIYLVCGITTALIFKPRIYKSKAYNEINPIVDHTLSNIQIGRIDTVEDTDVESEEIVAIPETPKEEIASQVEVAETEAATVEPAEETAPAEDPSRKYYKFTTLNSQQSLMIRNAPGFSGKVIDKMKPGDEGYVLVEGEKWCYVKKGDTIGYSSHEYLKLIEIPKEEFPAEYLNATSPMDLDVSNDEKEKGKNYR